MILYEYSHPPECKTSHVPFPFSEYTIMVKQCRILSIIRSGHVKTFESWESEILLQFIYTLLIMETLIHLKKFMKVDDITIIQGFRFWNDLMQDIHTFWIRIIHLWMFSWMEIVLDCYMGWFWNFPIMLDSASVTTVT